MTHPDLPKLFAEACAACPELTNETIDIERTYRGWWIGEGDGRPDNGHLASLAILGACVKVLLDKRGEVEVARDDGKTVVGTLMPGSVRLWGDAHPDPTCAACLAVVAVFKKENR